MGLSSKKSKSTTNQTVTPQVPAYAQGPVQDYYAQVGQLANNTLANIDAYKTPANAVQQAAQQAALNLGGVGQDGLAQSSAAAANLANQAAPTASLPGMPNAQGYTAQNVADVAGPQVANLGPANLAAAQGYSANTLDPASVAQAQAAMAQAGQVGPAAQAALHQAQAAQLGDAQSVNLGGYDAAQAQAASMLDNFAAYQNPATQSLVDATMAAYDDQAGRQQAAFQAQAAKNKAFGGSRYGIAEAQFAADTDRNRALTDAQLRDNAFARASQNAQFDAGNRQQASLFNAGALNDASRFTADARNTGSLFNAQAANDFARTRAGFEQETNLANAGWGNQNAQFNAGESNQNARTQAGLDTTTSVANAGNQTQASLANAASQNQFSLANQQALNAAAQFGAGAQNTANLANAQAQNQFGLAQFDAQNMANNLGFQGNLANAQQNAAAANAAAQFGANAQNAFAQQQFGAGVDLAQFNAAQQAQQNALALQAAAMQGQNAVNAGQLANQTAANQMNIGNSLWDVQSQNNMMPLTAMGAVGSLMNPGLINAVSGQNVSGTSTTKSSPSLFDSLLAVGQVAAGFSDRRLKRDVERVGTLEDGLGVYEWQYVWGGERHRGVMADEVEQLRPWALGPTVSGFATVNYGAL